ncbi:FAD-dependent oxidoreductase [Actinoplanes sp. SE50]|uniref:glycerol-3-phosphate dehydrogenase/oxidase n=1 Tax=unclassified Actinoplanes TaxID=2626549 RepID=UPI00023ECB3B|nr:MULTISPECIES: glycerol-3-phosphate dehydrogenase/oxidase [unclassified Actinoplanes]AEV84804.1 glycerol-3-phosphate dehydrogenase [Actinoplanes sp. SE50/110]ATO83196.1 FAD-dependent oxidoreductase [Actinoplanes sp. SE50]SLM00603.1 FAD-dependent oxidoreductase [Actinoplanes sp. SE50/110]
MKTGVISPESRRRALAAMTSGELDVLVVGAGVVGAGSALDAATRGLSVGLLEARDFASGTSSRSSKLIHGGLRYLEMLDFSLVREALRERGLLIQKLAPHLVRPVPFLYPLQRRAWERLYVGAGVALYDILALSGGGAGVPVHRHLSRLEALKAFPSLRPETLVGAIRYYDAQVDDARHTMFLVRTAVANGAHAASRTEVTGFLREGRRVVGVRARDLETGAELEIRARTVINATGVWTGDSQALLTGERGQFTIAASKGIHLVVPRDRIAGHTGIILRTATSVLFVIPWDQHWIIGTTDTAWNLDKSDPAASGRDVDYLLDEVNRALAVPLTRDDVQGVYAGLRPLLSAEASTTAKLSREHAVGHPVPGMVVVAGGKYTTYRVMAKDAVDAAVQDLAARVPASCTDQVPLLGADGYRAAWNRRQTLARESGLTVARIEALLHRYGTLLDEVLALIEADPSLALPLDGAPGHLRAEIVYAATHEGARHLEDVLARRTRIAFETPDRGVIAARAATTLLAPALGWSPADAEREVATYEAHVRAELAAQTEPDDRSADATLRALTTSPLTSAV